MTRAYHWVPKSGFPGVMEKGYLTPAIERLSPEFFRSRCAEDLDGILRDPDHISNPMAIEAVRSVVEDRIEDLSQMSEVDFSQKEFSQLGCIDFLAGDHESVFLQVGRWIDWGGDLKPTGFAFNAADLIREGAVLRDKDLASLYWAGFNKFLEKNWGSLGEARDALLQVFADIQRAHELHGKAALKALPQLGPRKASELLWNGRLPISLAVESFYPDIYLEA